MSLGALLVLAAASTGTPQQPPSLPAGAQVASAQVSVTIMRPVAVRQSSGVVEQDETPRFQLTRPEGTVLVEFQ
jgi:hypothetical protein